jgi:diguanylate cyclase (GGDEF)-like protein/PAS domain S-box-containing protein
MHNTVKVEIAPKKTATRSLYFLRIAGIAFAYASLAIITLIYFSPNGAASIIWPASGLALAALIIGGKKYWPAILIGALVTNLFNGDPFLQALYIAAGSTIAALVSFSILAYLKRLNNDLLELQDFLWLAFAGTLGALSAAIIGVTFTLLQTNAISHQQIVEELLHWWQGDTMGVLLLTPLILVWKKPPISWLNRTRIIETVTCFGLTFLVGQIIFLGWFHNYIPQTRGFWMFIFVTWAAVRFGRHGALLVIGITATQVFLGTISISGLFSYEHIQGNLINAWFYTLTISIVGMTLALIFERECALREAAQASIEERLKIATDSGQVAVWEMDLITNKLTWDNSMLTLYGVEREAFLGSYESWSTLVHPEDLAMAESAVSDAIKHAGAYRSEFRIIRPDGEVRYIKARGQVITNKNGTPISLIGTNMDNWAYSYSQQQLELAHTAINKSKTAFFWMAPEEGRVIDVNEAACQSLGYTREELIGMHVWDFDPAFQLPVIIKALEQLKKNTVSVIESTNRRKDGTFFPVEVTANYFSMNGEEYVFCTVQDITIRKQSENALALSEQRYKLLHQIGEETRLLTEPEEILKIITNLLGKHLQVSRCGYAEIEADGEHLVTIAGYVHDCPSIKGRRYPLSLFGPYTVDTFLSGNTLVINNIEETIPAGQGLELYTDINVKAVIGCTLIKQGKLQAIMGLHQTTSRQWTAEEISLTKEVADRCWVIIERAKAEKERMQLSDIIASSSNEIFIFDAQTLLFTYVNEGAKHNLGYTLDELLIMSPVDIKPEFTTVSFKAMIDPLLKNTTKKLIFETVHQRKNGTQYPAEIQLQLTDQDGMQFVAFVQDITARKQVIDELQATQTAIENCESAFFRMDAQGYVTYVNDYACKSLGYSKNELVGMHVTEFDPDFSEEAWEPMWENLKKNKTVKIETRHRRKDGVIFPVEVIGNFITEGDKEYTFTFVQNISDRKAAEESMRLAASVYVNSSEAMTVSDPEGRIITVNPAFTTITGYTAEEVIGKNRGVLSSGRHDESFYEAMWDEINTTGHWQGEIWDKRKNGEIYPAWLTINTIFDADNNPYRRITLFSDSTAWKETEELIWHQANFDTLTELPNRQMFHDQLKQRITTAKREAQSLALMFIDLDSFKEVNDSLGHDFGDELLKEAAKRISGCVRKTDTVARLGGDEFTIILSHFSESDGDLDRIAQNILNRMAEPFHLHEELAYISASIGITLFPQDAMSVDELIKNADQAMYAAKNQGRNRYHYFTPSMQERAQARRQMANDLRAGLENNEFWLAYQPIIELSTGALYKAEALIRWQHPVLGLVNPTQFIPVAEHTGLIIEIGEWVFRETISQVKHWQQTYQKEFQISVNVSPVQFHDKLNRLNAWQQLLKQEKLSGKSVIIEITEGLLLEANPITSETLLAFRDAGMQIALDDFGTGYSSLSYLKKFQIDYIKIDQSFVQGLPHNAGDLALCEAMIVMAHKLDMKVIAEGVETKEQQEILKEIGCDYAQGYLISKPIPARGFERLFKH